MRNKRLIVIFSVLLSVTMLVLLGSIIFSVKTVAANCYNYTAFNDELNSTELNKLIEGSVSLKGKSIFLIDDEEVISLIEKNVPSVKVVNIERVFPNSVRINYVKMFSYFETKIEDTYYEFLCDGKVVRVSSTKSEIQRINIKAGLSGSFDVGDYILDSFLTQAATAFERLGLGYQNAATFFEFLDFTKEPDVVFVGIRNSNTVFKIYGKDNFLEHLRLAYSFYCNPDLFNPLTDTMIIVANGTGFCSTDRYVP